MLGTVFIYALNCPITGRTRYVGKAKDPVKRLGQHLSDSCICHRTNWIRSLALEGRKPLLEVLAEVPMEFWSQWEVAWIEFYREQGFDLVNGSLGGDGSNGVQHSVEARHKNRLAHLGRKHSAKTRKKIGQIWLGRKRGPRSEAHKAKLRAANLGKRQTTEARATNSESKKGLVKSKEHCEALSKAKRLWWAQRKGLI